MRFCMSAREGVPADPLPKPHDEWGAGDTTKV